MTARPGRWHLIGPSSDPVPTDGADVKRVADGHRQTADQIATVAHRLDRLSRLSGWTGDAAEEFATHAEDGAEDLRKTYDRYDGVADALSGWQSPVDTARRESAAALADAERADADRIAHSRDLLAGVAEPTEADLAAQRRQQERHADAVRRLADAGERLSTAMEAFGDAARRVAGQIKDAADTYKDGWRDDFKGWIRDHAGLIKAICDVLSKVAMVLAAITLVVALTIGAPFWLLAAGLVVAVLLLAGHTSLVVSGSGLATWTDVAFDLVGVATAGYGMYAARGLQAAVATARSGVADEVLVTTRNAALAREAATVEARLANNASHIRDPLNNLRIWSEAQRAGQQTRALAAAQAAQQQVLDTARLSPQLLQRIRLLDVDLATQLRQVQALRGFTPSAALTQSLDDLTASINRLGAAGATGLAGQIGGETDALTDRVEGAREAVSRELDEARWRLTTAGR